MIGGDGSIHEVINGLLQRDMKGEPLIPLGFIPGGSGNSIMLDLGTWSVAEVNRDLFISIQCNYMNHLCHISSAIS